MLDIFLLWRKRSKFNYIAVKIDSTQLFSARSDVKEDHWFMYCDGNAIRYYRSWTGVCFAEAYYEKSCDGYRITELRINNNPDEYRLNDVDAAVALFYALLISEYGGCAGPYWKAAF